MSEYKTLTPTGELPFHFHVEIWRLHTENTVITAVSRKCIQLHMQTHDNTEQSKPRESSPTAQALLLAQWRL